MAATCPIDLDLGRVRAQVIDTYDRLAREPDADFHFHRGAAYAARQLGYSAEELATLPRRATDRFAGVGNPVGLGEVPVGGVILDHACGAGTDLLLAARRLGPTGRAIGVDVTPAMRTQAMLAATEAGLADRVEIRAGMMEELPLADASVDLVLSNGVVNLAPDKEKVFHEIARVLKPGGRLQLADVVVAHDLRTGTRQNADLWAACVAGAAQPEELVELARSAGLIVAPRAIWYDCFRGSAVEERVARSLRVRAVGLVAWRTP